MNGGLLSVLTALAAVTVVADTEIVPQFRIGTGGYYRTNPKVCTEGHAIELKEAGIDFVYDVEISNRDFLDCLHKHGLYAYALRAIGYWCGGNGSRAGKMPEVWPRATYEKQITDIRSHLDHPAIRGFMLADEPSAIDMEYIGKIAALLKKELPDKAVFVNLYPCYASVDENTSSQEKSQLGCATYEEHVETYCRTIPLDYISYDHYPYFEKDETTLSKLPRYYGNFKTVSDACHRTGRAFWMIPQVNSRKGAQPLSRNNLRFQAYASMAFGAETLVWECWCPGWWTNNVYTAEGEKTEQYDKLKEVNFEIRRFAPDYMRFRNVATHFVGRWSDAESFAKYGISARERLDAGFFKDVGAEDGSSLVVGEMVARRTDDGARALFVFAADDATDVKRATHRVRIRPSVSEVKGIGSGAPLRLERADDGSFVFDLADNACALLIADAGSETRKIAGPDRSRCGILTGGFYGAYPKERADELVSALKECGFVGANCVRGCDTVMLDALKKQGVGAVVQRGIPYWFGGDGSRAGKMHEVNPRAEYERLLASHDSIVEHPAIIGYDFVDEPSALDMPYVGEIAALIGKRHREKFIYVNLYPNYAVADENTGSQKISQLGVQTYDEYIDAYCRHVPIDYISYDHYTFFEKIEDTIGKAPRYYGNMKVVADACRRTGRSFWFIAQACSRKRGDGKPSRFLSVDNLRFQTYSAMAFGVESVCWANFLQAWWTNNLYTADGVRTEQFDKVRTVNAEIRRFDGAYMRFRNTDTVFVGFGAGEKGLSEYGIPSIDAFSDGYFKDVRASDGSRLVVGEMVSRSGSGRYRAILVFGADDIADQRRATHEVRFGAVAPVRVIGPDGDVRVRALANGDCAIDLRDCSCALIVMRLPVVEN